MDWSAFNRTVARIEIRAAFGLLFELSYQDIELEEGGAKVAKRTQEVLWGGLQVCPPHRRRLTTRVWKSFGGHREVGWVPFALCKRTEHHRDYCDWVVRRPGISSPKGTIPIPICASKRKPIPMGISSPKGNSKGTFGRQDASSRCNCCNSSLP